MPSRRSRALPDRTSTGWDLRANKRPRMPSSIAISTRVSFRFIATGGEAMGEEGIPTPVYRALSKSDRAVLLKHVSAAIKEQRECAGRVLTLSAQNPAATPDVLTEKVRDIQMDCRRATLKARDQLLGKLPPEGRTALRAFVESQKQGQTMTVLKSDLARFRLPE